MVELKATTTLDQLFFAIGDSLVAGCLETSIAQQLACTLAIVYQSTIDKATGLYDGWNIVEVPETTLAVRNQLIAVKLVECTAGPIQEPLWRLTKKGLKVFTERVALRRDK